MAKITTFAGIESLHGKFGDVYYRTTKDGKIILCKLPKKRKSPLRQHEKTWQETFGKLTKTTSEIIANPLLKATYEQLYRQSHLPKETLRQFIFRYLRNHCS